MTTTVVVITLNRPEYIRRCLERLAVQDPPPDQVIVVDASADDLTRQVVGSFPGVLYARNENGLGRMTTSRNIALQHAEGDIIAFVDDDAFAHSGWLRNLVETYSKADIGAVGGRALNNLPGEDVIGVNEIGRLKPNGELTGYFAANPGKVIEVDHLMGCNMSFRREVLARLGGFREDYPGIAGLREDTDMCLRVRRLGFRILFNPAAAVDHVAGPQAYGRRFDARYVFFGVQNHCVMLIRHRGALSQIVFRYVGGTIIRAQVELARRVCGAVIRLAAVMAGLLVGVSRGVWSRAQIGDDPVRVDSAGRNITNALSAVQCNLRAYAPQTDRTSA